MIAVAFLAGFGGAQWSMRHPPSPPSNDAVAGQTGVAANLGRAWTVPAGAPMKVHVPEDIADIASAIAAIAPWRIGTNASVEIRVAPGRYGIAAPLIFDHPDGRRISIVAARAATSYMFAQLVSVVDRADGGADVNIRLTTASALAVGDWIRVSGTEGSGGHEVFRGLFPIVAIEGSIVRVRHDRRAPGLPSISLTAARIFKPAVQLVFNPSANNKDYFAIDVRTALGDLVNVAILSETQNARATGLRLSDGANLSGGTGEGNGGLSIGGWGRHCLWAFRNAQAVLDGLTVSGCGSSGVYSIQGAQTEAIRAQATGSGVGFAVSDGGQITCAQCVTARSGTGFLAVAGGRIIAPNSRAIASPRAGVGYRARPGGFIWAEGATARFNETGFFADGGSIWLPNAIAQDNRAVQFNPPTDGSMLQGNADRGSKASVPQ